MKQEKKKRVIDLAQALGLSNTALVAILSELGYKVKSPMSPITDEMETAIKEKIATTKREHEESLKRKRRIWGEEKGDKKESTPTGKLKRDKSIIKEKVKETLSKGVKKTVRPKRKKTFVNKEIVEEKKKKLFIPGAMSLGELAKMLGVDPADLVKRALERGILATINQVVDIETIMVLAEEEGYEIELKEEALMEEEEEVELHEKRPPVVTIMGHVDHGKTTLLDYIRKTNITSQELGAITQHIGAYSVTHRSEKICFIDTPGHEAFTALRARGAEVTDIVVLVVSAVEGVKPQTIEALNHARAAQVPVIVAINKMDLPDAKPDEVKRELSEEGLTPEEWGGDTMTIEISARTGEGVDDLLDAILLKAEELSLKTTTTGRVKGIVLETSLERGRGPIATVIIQQGILRVGSNFVAGGTSGRVRAIYDEWGRKVSEVLPSTPAIVQGFDSLPKAGDVLYVTETEKEAREKASTYREIKKEQITRGEFIRTTKRLQEPMDMERVKDQPIIVKVDCQGSLEAVSDAIARMVYEEVRTQIIHQGIGNVTESDVLLASASNAVIVAFNVGAESQARKLVESEGVTLLSYKVIYELIEGVKGLLSGLLEPELKEIILAKAEIKEVFPISKLGKIAGCYVLEGTLTRDARVRVKRNGDVIFSGNIASLKRFKEDVKEVREGYECGIKIEGFDTIKVGDILEFFKIEKIVKELT